MEVSLPKRQEGLPESKELGKKGCDHAKTFSGIFKVYRRGR